MGMESHKAQALHQPQDTSINAQCSIEVMHGEWEWHIALSFLVDVLRLCSHPGYLASSCMLKIATGAGRLLAAVL